MKTEFRIIVNYLYVWAAYRVELHEGNKRNYEVRFYGDEEALGALLP